LIEIAPLSALFAGAAIAVLIAIASWALFTGLRARREAAALGAGNARLEALLGGAPALAMIVRADGRLEMSDRLGTWLGFSQMPGFLADLSGNDAGFDAADLAMLSEDVAAAQKSARRFRRSLRPQGSSRMLIVIGDRATHDMQAPGGVVLWFFDATESETDIARLADETSRVRSAYEALLGLIEAAPLPMWYRGADLRLLMVNSAYVDAVDGRDAEEVVAAGLELVEGAGIGGPLANAVAARDAGRAQAQAMPATIKGERRMLRIFDVPLTTGGIAGFAIDIDELEQARSGIKRFGEAQRAMLDRLSAGVVQFGADRTLAFCNQPFRRMFAMRSEWLTDRPEFDRVLERMREANRLPEVRDFPGWRRSGAIGSPPQMNRSRRIGTFRAATISGSWPSRSPTAGCC